MPLDPTRPIIYLVTSGKTTARTTPESEEFSNLLTLIEAAAASKVPLIQIREKNLTARVLYQLLIEAVARTSGTQSRLLVNDRFDIALAAGASGVQLTSRSIDSGVVRRNCGEEFLIGVSTHSLDEALHARDQGADFVVFGPVFETESKRLFGPPQGIEKLEDITAGLSGFPVIAIGGVSRNNVGECFAAGAAGIAAIKLLGDAQKLGEIVEEIKAVYWQFRRAH